MSRLRKRVNSEYTQVYREKKKKQLKLKLYCHIDRIKLYNRNNGIAFYPRKHQNQSVHAHVSLFSVACACVFIKFGQTHLIEINSISLCVCSLSFSIGFSMQHVHCMPCFDTVQLMRILFTMRTIHTNKQ